MISSIMHVALLLEPGVASITGTGVDTGPNVGLYFLDLHRDRYLKPVTERILAPAQQFTGIRLASLQDIIDASSIVGGNLPNNCIIIDNVPEKVNNLETHVIYSTIDSSGITGWNGHNIDVSGLYLQRGDGTFFYVITWYAVISGIVTHFDVSKVLNRYSDSGGIHDTMVIGFFVSVHYT